MWTVESTGCVMTLKSQNQGGWYHLLESFEKKKEKSFVTNPILFLKKKRKLSLLGHFCQAQGILQKETCFSNLIYFYNILIIHKDRVRF